MPMDMRKLVAQQFIIHFDGPKHSHQCVGDGADIFNHTVPFLGRQMEQLGGMPLQYQHRPSGKELIIEQVYGRNGAVCNPMVGGRPCSFAGHARSIHDREVSAPQQALSMP